MTDEHSATQGKTAGTAIDTTVPHSARIWNYWLGGTDNYAVDREAGDQYKEVFPGIAVVARTSRGFLTRAVRYLAAEGVVRVHQGRTVRAGHWRCQRSVLAW